MCEQSHKDLLDLALGCEQESSAKALFAVAWRSADLDKKNERLEALVGEISAFEGNPKIEIADEPEAWQGDFETEEVRFLRRKYRPAADFEFFESIVKGIERVKNGAKRNRTLREGIDKVRHGRSEDKEEKWPELSELVLDVTKKQGECYCGCGCHYCPLCASFLNRQVG